jgi:hypothetical protein
MAYEASGPDTVTAPWPMTHSANRQDQLLCYARHRLSDAGGNTAQALVMGMLRRSSSVDPAVTKRLKSEDGMGNGIERLVWRSTI